MQMYNMKVVIVKYNAGNIQSVLYALERIGVNAIVTDDHAELLSADKVIFPGVGEASSAMSSLKENRLNRIAEAAGIGHLCGYAIVVQVFGRK